MPIITAKDGTQIYYKDWGSGQPVVFSHGWPLSADAFEDQMLFLAANGYRCIAHDRRGHGRSSQPWNGNDLDTYADDMAELVQALDLQDAVHVGHSTGGGEVARYIGRHGTKRVSKAVLIGAIPPLMLKTETNPGGLPLSIFDEIRAGVLKDRSQFFTDLSAPFYGANRPDAKVSQGLRDSFWLQGMLAGHKAVFDCIKAFSETDLTEDLKKFDVPTLVLHGDDDQIVPIGASALLSVFGHLIWPTLATRIGPLIKTEPDSFVLAGFRRPGGAAGWIGKPKWNYTRRSGASITRVSERF